MVKRLGGSLVYGGDVGRVVDRLTEWMGDSIPRQRLVGRIGLDEQPVARHSAEGVVLPRFAFMREGTGKAEVGAE
ncbi:uncharacterized protein METZ01_LOCUS15318 [marine metagenome]|uniref:Uncharacterized protein n=1 Tax=marine metagenome TaxID=408172 RepID=A0A381P794_9ZZZZ